MKTITTSLNVEGIDFKLTFNNGEFFFDDKFKEFVNKEFKTFIFNNQSLNNIFSFNYDFISRSFIGKNIAFELQANVIQSQKLPNKKGFIYLVTDGDFTKIGGTTYNVKKRLLELQTGNAKKLSILGYYKCEYLNITEKLIHNKYKDKNELNEWFRLDIKDCESILQDKFIFTTSENIKILSHASIINIICEQITILRDYNYFRIKQNKRLLNKYSLDKVFFKILSSEKIKKIKNNIVEKYIGQRYSIDFLKQQISISNTVTKNYDEILSISNWINLLNKDLYNYINLHNIEYNDDKEMWVFSDNFEQPLKFNNGTSYIVNIRDIPSI